MCSVTRVDLRILQRLVRGARPGRIPAIQQDVAEDGVCLPHFDGALAGLRERKFVSPAGPEELDLGADVPARFLAGRYRFYENRIVHAAGRGIFYLGQEFPSKRDVAIKQVPGKQPVPRLKHPHIASVLDVVYEDGETFVILPYFTQGSLADRIRAQGAMSPAGVLEMLIQVTEALASARERGVTHGNLKAENILLPGNEISDFEGSGDEHADRARLGEIAAALGGDLPGDLALIVHRLMQGAYASYADLTCDLERAVSSIPHRPAAFVGSAAATYLPGLTAMIRGIVHDLTYEGERLRAAFESRYGAACFLTRPDFMEALLALAKERRAIDACATVQGIEAAAFEEQYRQRAIPPDLPHYVRAAIRYAEEGRARGAIDPRPAETLLRFLRDSFDAPALASFRLEASSSWSARYEIRRLLGRGRRGDVYATRDRILDRDVAVRVCDRATVGDLKKAAEILDGRHVVPVHDWGQEGAKAYVVSSLARGRTFAQLLRQRGSIPPAEAKDLVRQVEEGLRVLDAAGIVHGRITSSNLIVDDQGTARIMDLGLAAPTNANDREDLRRVARELGI